MRAIITLLFLMLLSESAGADNWQDNKNTIQFQPGPLEKLVVPSDWPFIKKSSFLDRHAKYSVNQSGIDKKSVNTCVQLLSKWKKNNDAHRRKREGDFCIQKLGWWYYKSRDTVPIRDVILSWATKQKPTFDVYQDDFNPDHYDAIALLTVFSSFYAVKYDEFEFSQSERIIVDDFVLNEMLTIPINLVGEPKNKIFCNPFKHSLIGKKEKPQVNLNTCGSNRWKTTIAQLLVALRLGNQDLFKQGVYNTRFKLALFDNQGIYVPWATRGALAWDYSHDVTTMLSLLTEIYQAVGYDFLDHQLETGLFVHELFKKQFEIVDNVSILEKYAVRQYAVKGTNYSAWKKLSNDEKIRDWPKESLAYSAKVYIQKFAPQLQRLIDCETSVFAVKASAITTFNIIDIWELHYSQNSTGYCSS